MNVDKVRMALPWDGTGRDGGKRRWWEGCPGDRTTATCSVAAARVGHKGPSVQLSRSPTLLESGRRGGWRGESSVILRDSGYHGHRQHG